MWNVNFNEAIAYAGARNVILGDEYYLRMTGLQRHQSVSIAGLAQLEQVDYIIGMVHKALETGASYQDFVKAVRSGELATDLPDYRLDNIFRTNMQSAYNRGRWYQQQRLKKYRPYLMYDAINDNRTRPNHKALDGVIRHIDDSFWDTHYAPLGYRCRCKTVSLTEKQALAKGITPDDKLPDAEADSTDFGMPPNQYTEKFDKLVNERYQKLMLEHYRHAAELVEVKNRFDATVKAVLSNSGILAQWVASNSQVNTMAKSFAEYENTYNLTVDEYSAIRYYTGMGADDLNKLLNGLSNVDDTYAKQLVNASNLLTRALDKLPNYQGIVTRRVTADSINLAEHKVGNTVVYNGFSSSTYGKADVFGERRVRLVIQSKTGKKIDALSMNSNEQEVLFRRGTRFEVTGRKDSKELIEIQLKEID